MCYSKSIELRISEKDVKIKLNRINKMEKNSAKDKLETIFFENNYRPRSVLLQTRKSAQFTEAGGFQ